MNPHRGFESYNKFKKNIRDIKQLYDITYHLYIQEHDRLESEVPKAKKSLVTIKTSVGGIEHSLTSLYQRLQSSYPFKLRQLLLINAITSMEVFLTDVVYEIFQRDISPFKEDTPVSLQKNYLLSLSSLKELQEKIIRKEIRNLTSGGLQIIEKYYKKKFNVDFKNLGVSLNDIEEIHTRRHLFVHRDGIVDAEYSNKYPSQGYTEAQQIKIEHDYLIEALDKLSQFSALVNKKLLELFPSEIRKPKYKMGIASFDLGKKNLMIEIGLSSENYDYENFLDSLQVRGVHLKNFVTQITIMEKSIFIFLSGDKELIMRFFKPIKDNDNLSIIRIIELKNNDS